MDKIGALREALGLGFEDDVFVTDDSSVFMVEKKKAPGVYGFCNSIPDEMEVYKVIDVSEGDGGEELDRAPDFRIGRYAIYRE